MTDRSGQVDKIEVPYCVMSALKKLKTEKSISELASTNPLHPLVAAVDRIPGEIEL